MTAIRRAPFVVAVILMTIVVMIEMGSLGLPSEKPNDAQSVNAMCASTNPAPAECNSRAGQAELANRMAQARDGQPPYRGMGIPYLALVDGLLLFVAVMMLLSFVVPARIQGRLQGLASLIFSVLLLLAAIVMVFVALGLLITMVSLFLSVPFGTIAYLAIWGFFNRGGALAALSLIMMLKIAFVICLAIAHQSFLTDKGLVLIVAASFVASLVVALLLGLVPIFLVSITDALAAIIVAIIAIIMIVLSLAGSLMSIVKAIRVEA